MGLCARGNDIIHLHVDEWIKCIYVDMHLPDLSRAATQIWCASKQIRRFIYLCWFQENGILVIIRHVPFPRHAASTSSTASWAGRTIIGRSGIRSGQSSRTSCRRTRRAMDPMMETISMNIPRSCIETTLLILSTIMMRRIHCFCFYLFKLYTILLKISPRIRTESRKSTSTLTYMIKSLRTSKGASDGSTRCRCILWIKPCRMCIRRSPIRICCPIHTSSSRKLHSHD